MRVGVRVWVGDPYIVIMKAGIKVFVLNQVAGQTLFVPPPHTDPPYTLPTPHTVLGTRRVAHLSGTKVTGGLPNTCC